MNEVFKPRPFDKKKSFIYALIGAFIITLIESFLFENTFLGLRFLYSSIMWTLTLYALQHLVVNKKKGKYIKSAWFFGFWVFPILFAPLYYVYKDDYSPKELNPEYEKE